jgi:hypothetical protein
MCTLQESRAGILNLLRPGTTFTLPYQLAGLNNMNEDNLLKFHGNLLTRLGKKYSLENIKIPKVSLGPHFMHNVIEDAGVITADVITHAQRITRNGAIILPPHVFDISCTDVKE